MWFHKKKKKEYDESYFFASQWQLMGRKLVKHKLAKISILVLGILYGVALFGKFIAPSDLVQYDKDSINMPPTQVHLFHEGKLVGPFVYGITMQRNPDTFRKEYIENTDEIYKVKWFTHGVSYKIFGKFECDLHLFGVEDGGRLFVFGTDGMGRDLLSRIILGSRISLTIPFAGTAISFLLGILLGGISGYFGGFIDSAIQRIIEVLSSLPTIPLWMALAAAIPSNISVTRVYLYITIIISFISWTGLARVVRGKFISLRNEDFVMAAKVAGVSNRAIIVRHMVPGFMSYLIVNLTLGIPGMILSETSMSYLGLGIRAPATSWGVLLQEAQEIANIASYPWKLLPLAFVILTVLAFNFLGDGLRDAADPYK